jgi:hypothetical protein
MLDVHGILGTLASKTKRILIKVAGKPTTIYVSQ